MTTAGPVLRLDRITKRFGPLLANDAISLDLGAGEVVALLGENGAGKSTLMNILFGEYVADGGSITAFGRPLPPGTPRAALEAGIGMVHQHFALADQMTVIENIVLGTRPFWARQRLTTARDRISTISTDYGLAVDPDARVGSLSVGERQRVEILKALYRDARILILDEPTAVLTPQEADALFATLRRMVAGGLSVIFISHKLHEVMAIADRCVVLRHGRVAGEVRTAETTPAALAALMVGGEVARVSVKEGVKRASSFRLLSVSTRGGSAATGLRGVDRDLHGGQITAIAGVSGNGQAALAAVIGGLVVPEGRIEIAGQPAPVPWTPAAALAAGIGRIPEDRHREGTVADMTLAENAVLETHGLPPISRAGWMDWRAARGRAEVIIAAYDIRCPGPDARIRLLSGGNMQKLILGRVLEAQPRVVLANQPVRGLDVGAVAFVHGALVAARDRGAAVLLISEDLDEILTLADVIHVISRGRLSPPIPRDRATVADLGLRMAGQGLDRAA